MGCASTTTKRTIEQKTSEVKVKDDIPTNNNSIKNSKMNDAYESYQRDQNK